jgi:Tfp pilus assembly ATPase PilU
MPLTSLDNWYVLLDMNFSSHFRLCPWWDIAMRNQFSQNHEILLWEINSRKTMWYCYEKSILAKPCDIAMRNPFSQNHVILLWEINSRKTMWYCYEKSILAKPCDIAMRNPFSQNHVILLWEINSHKTMKNKSLQTKSTMAYMYKSLVCLS